MLSSHLKIADEFYWKGIHADVRELWFCYDYLIGFIMTVYLNLVTTKFANNVININFIIHSTFIITI